MYINVGIIVIIMKNALTEFDPVILTFDFQLRNHVNSSISQGHSSPCLNTLGSFVFDAPANRQTNIQISLENTFKRPSHLSSYLLTTDHTFQHCIAYCIYLLGSDVMNIVSIFCFKLQNTGSGLNVYAWWCRIGRGTGYKISELQALADGHMLVIGGKQIEVHMSFAEQLCDRL